MIALIVILVAAVILLLANRLRPDVIALAVALALGLTGVVTPEESMSGFSHPAVLTLMALFIISQGVTRRGATRLITTTLSRLGQGDETRLLVATMAGSAFLSLFMNNVAAAAVMLPPVSDAAARARVPAARLMMPLAFATSLGGMATLLTTGNLVVGAALREAGYRPYGLLDFALVGVPIILAGLLYMLTVGRRTLAGLSAVDALTLPDPRPELTVQYALRERVVQYRIGPEAALLGKTLGQCEFGSRLGLTVLAVQRRGRFVWTP
ncbi:MAG TPA: SLC13 family permease, partial [Thermoflexales bacterium]|nr:SLC13 family permease [Thermoflexales bacterium]